MLALGDQALIDAAHFQSLLDTWRDAPYHIVTGAKWYLQRFQARVTQVPLPESAFDIDHQQDVAVLNNYQNLKCGSNR